MTPNSSNRPGLDYRVEARAFAPLPVPIIDVHTHISGKRAALLLREAAELYGVSSFYSMTPLEELEQIQEALGDAVRFIAISKFGGENPEFDVGVGYIERLRSYRAHGAVIAKFWAAPRIVDFGSKPFRESLLRLSAPGRLEAMRTAVELGYILMVHVGDPDTWFATKYRDSERYGTKREHYEDLEIFLEQAKTPTIAAHMGGWPEDLSFLSRLLERFPLLYLDTSATKWMVRELSTHAAPVRQAFFERWRGRILFGSDIVTSDLHLSTEGSHHPMAMKASNEQEAFDLYASRYWALRTLFERDYAGESPIVDPDLAMVDPQRFGPDASPQLQGAKLSTECLGELYNLTAQKLLGR